MCDISMVREKGMRLYVQCNMLFSVTAERHLRMNYNTHVRWGPCPHSMARPRVADGGTTFSYGG
jgi:hypothetical protein